MELIQFQQQFKTILWILLRLFGNLVFVFCVFSTDFQNPNAAYCLLFFSVIHTRAPTKYENLTNKQFERMKCTEWEKVKQINERDNSYMKQYFNHLAKQIALFPCCPPHSNSKTRKSAIDCSTFRNVLWWILALTDLGAVDVFRFHVTLFISTWKSSTYRNWLTHEYVWREVTVKRARWQYGFHKSPHRATRYLSSSKPRHLS